MDTLQTTADVLEAIRRHGESAYPEEGCGFLLGRIAAGGAVQAVRTHRADNEREAERERRFTLSPAAYRAAEAAAEAEGLDVVGFYHSHPDHPARPSETDVAEAPFPGYAYVIISVENGRSVALTAWDLCPDRSGFDPCDIAPILANTFVS